MVGNHQDSVKVKALPIMCTVCFSAVVKELISADSNSLKGHTRVLKELLRSKGEQE